MAVPLPAGICIITRVLIGGSGSDYDSITRALISEGSKLRAKKNGVVHHSITVVAGRVWGDRGEQAKR